TASPPADGSGLSDVIVVVVFAAPAVTLLLQVLLPSPASATSPFGSTPQAPPPRGFENVAAASGVAVKTTSNDALAVPNVTEPPVAVQVRVPLAIAQLTFAPPVTPAPTFATLTVP